MIEARAKKSDLGVRTASAAVMIAVSGIALWLGGWVWTAFVALVAAGVLWEWIGLVRGFADGPVARGLWNAGGVAYVGLAAAMLVLLRSPFFAIAALLALVLAVIATDVGAYFAGRAIGGPKIAPRISPSKTWAGLGGGVLGASLVILAWTALGQYAMARSIEIVIRPVDQPGFWESVDWGKALAQSIPVGMLLAIVAQAGDFFESWMKRRAGVKDSGKLLPGHGGLFDRLDGLLAVLFVSAMAMVALLVYDGVAFR